MLDFSQKSWCDYCLYTAPELETGPSYFNFLFFSSPLLSLSPHPPPTYFPKSATNSSQTDWLTEISQGTGNTSFIALRCKISSFANWSHTLLSTFPDTFLLQWLYQYGCIWLKCPPHLPVLRSSLSPLSAISSMQLAFISKLTVISPQPLHLHPTYGTDHFLCLTSY